MSEVKNITCISCPMGCGLTVYLEDNVVLNVTGNQCPKGKKYAEEECINPTRILTTTLPIKEGQINVISVKSDRPVPKANIMGIMAELKEIYVTAPIEIGEVIVKDIHGMKVNLISTKNVLKKL